MIPDKVYKLCRNICDYLFHLFKTLVLKIVLYLFNGELNVGRRQLRIKAPVVG